MNAQRILAAWAGVLLGLFAIVPAPAAQEALRAVRAPGTVGPLFDPDAAFWADAPAVTVAMQPQIIATPQNPEPAVAELMVKAAHNGQWLSFLVEWADDSKSDRVLADRFGDQVAVELPVSFDTNAPPNPMMGAADGRVTIMQWRAAFQRDLEDGEPTVQDLYPNAHADVYPDQVLRVTDARPYMGAVGVDNPISHPSIVPVLDQMAEGWGTLTVKLEQNVEAKGVWRSGGWRVVITRPMSTADRESDPQLSPGDETVAAFAVWEGGHREVGARKAWSDWVPLTLDP